MTTARFAPRLAFMLALALAPLAGAAEPEAPKPVDVSQATPKMVFRDCERCPQMVIVAPGTFTMGAPASEPGYFVMEGPVHKVSVKRFALGRYPVTRSQYEAFATATRRKAPSGCAWSPTAKTAADAAWNRLGFPQDDSHPVVCVSFQDASDYVAWLSRQTGRPYRLPSEAEWEYAARAGSSTAYPWGDTASHDQANYGSDKCCGPLKQGADQWLYTSPVGSFPKNAFGFFDMNGNVSQWTQDCLSTNYLSTPTDGSAQLKGGKVHGSGDLADLDGLDACEHHMLRGGNWGDTPTLVRTAARNFAPAPGDRYEGRSGGIGLRVAASLP